MIKAAAQGIGAAALALVWTTGAGAAQLSQAPTPQQLPPDATPRLEQRFRDQAPVPPPSMPSLQIETPEAETAPDSAASIPLTIETLTLTGVTVYRSEDLDEYWRDRVGKPGTLGDLFTIAAEITARYRNDGYVLSRAIVPAQEIEDGKVEIRVIEGYVDRVVFEGNDDRPGLLRDLGERIVATRPTRLATLERYLLLMGDQPGVTVTSVLKPSPDQTGAADLVINVERDLIQSFVTFDNRGTRYVGPFQGTIGTRINSLFGLADQTFVRAITTPVDINELMAFDVSNLQVLDGEGTTFATQLNYAEAKPGFRLKPLRLTSEASTIGFILSRPVVRTRTSNLKINVQASANEYRTTTALFDEPLLRDSIRSIRVAAVWETVDNWRGANSVGLQFSHGLDILGATKTGTSGMSRSLGRSDYYKLNFDASRVQSLGGGWNLLGAFSSQIAFTSLLASEQFGLGGSQFLRAYDPGDMVGDSGVGAKFELQYGEQPKLSYLQDYQFYGYVDLGRVQNLRTLPGEKSSDSGLSLGLGTRFTLTESVAGYFEIAQPLFRPVLTQGADAHNHQPRAFFALIAKF